MKEIEIIVKALTAEALQKPDEKVIAGKEIFTYKEFAAMLNSKKLQKNHKRLIESFLQSAQKMFKENPSYRQKIMQLAGAER
jgi:hypothetical protein